MDNNNVKGMNAGRAAVPVGNIGALLGAYTGPQYVGLWTFVAAIQAPLIAAGSFTPTEIDEKTLSALTRTLNNFQSWGVPTVDELAA